jgi:hypothetical protein
MQALFKVMNVKVAFAVKHHKIVAVPLMVTEKEILAMLRPVFLPILAGNLYRRCFGVGVMRVLKIVLLEE